MVNTSSQNGAGAAEDVYVHEVPGVCGGYPVVRNTRIAVSLLVEFQRQGVTVEQLAEWYSHVGIEAIRGALEYYARHPERVDEDIQRQQQALANLVERNGAIQGHPWQG